MRPVSAMGQTAWSSGMKKGQGVNENVILRPFLEWKSLRGLRLEMELGS